MRRMDITDLPLQDESVTLVYCSHVLEHVADDRKAMSELHRVLAPGGLAVIQVPIIGEQTYEDRSITTPEGRLRAFLQHDHVRIYGIDIVARLVAAGFDVEVQSVDHVPPPLVERQRLRFPLTNEVFLARRSPTAA